MSLILRPGEENGRLGSLKPDHESVRDVPDYLILLSAEYFGAAEGLLRAGSIPASGPLLQLGLRCKISVSGPISTVWASRSLCSCWALCLPLPLPASSESSARASLTLAWPLPTLRSPPRGTNPDLGTCR